MPIVRYRRNIVDAVSLEAGHKLAHYEILEPIGKGGMGEVYRARDGKLGRDVAIKVLPDEFAENEERLARFKREAKVLASLNHPNIAAIHGLEESDGTHYLVLELVPGETLAERLSRGPIPVDEAVEIAMKIVDALEQAHEKGIVHRDLKPANVMLTPDGKVIVLDFGLAKAFEDETVDPDSSMSPTLTRLRQGSGGQARDGTRMGVILGTAAYMSPEQAKGKQVDKRTDIFAFGALVYEMLTGKKAFPGEDVSDVLASVLKMEPDWKAVPSDLDPRIHNLLRRCLRKDRKKRLRDVGDARNELEEILADPAGASVSVPARSRSRERLPWLGMTAFVLSTLVLALVHFLEAPLELPPVRFSVLPPADVARFSNVQFAVSPDGRSLAFVGIMAGGGQMLGIRPLDSLEPRMLPGTEGAGFPFWSPDNQFIGYFAGGKLKKVRASGGPSETLCDTTDRRTSGSWNHDDVIIFGSNQGILRVTASGGSGLGSLKRQRRHP